MQHMTRLLDILDRSLEGPICDEKEFDLDYVAKITAEMVKKHGIQFDQSKIIQDDDEMIDRLWEAGLELFERCGIYNTSTGRRMIFSRREIEEVIARAPSTTPMGCGVDQRMVVHRQVGDPRPPRIIGGAIGVPMSEELFVPIMESYVKEPLLDGVSTGILQTAHGRELRTGSPMELLASWRDVDLMFPLLKRAGRPGLQLGAINQSPTALGFLSAVDEQGYRPTDRHAIAIIGELKTNNDALTKLVHTVRSGGLVFGFFNPIFGGLGGGEEGVAVLLTAGEIGAEMIYMASTLCTCPTHPIYFSDTAPQILRLVSAVTATIARNTPMLFTVMTSPEGGPGTDSLLYECVAMATTASACGASQLLGVRSAVGVVAHHSSGLEARFNAEVGIAAAALSREEANAIVEKAVAKYEPLMGSKPIGQPFSEVYDMNKLVPLPAWLDVYDRVKEDAASWGLSFG
jgi:methylamine---corrinoid protein Co-methyltransferase